jgi:enoyl-CoA hydratase/carnithine racemase
MIDGRSRGAHETVRDDPVREARRRRDRHARSSGVAERVRRRDARRPLRGAGASTTIRTCAVLVLRGAGRAFSTGGDLREFGSAPRRSSRARVRFQRDVWGRLLGSAPRRSRPSTGTVGGGMEMALLCDVRIAADDARFALPGDGARNDPRRRGTQTLPRAWARRARST